ncbi:BgtE-10129 [Blumeria graminis f. sp. tritici]|uniref:BgtE-10129 n=2 Tax=Blumeria graminis f. sp. tritici TaxID=62690 RepID=A0A9X9MF56_BLUGR|nr:BgtE-10129 [Blumeria graminis f. sp. tritici]
MKLQTITQLVSFLCFSSMVSAGQKYTCFGQDINWKDIQTGLKALKKPSATQDKLSIHNLFYGDNLNGYISRIPLKNYNNDRGRYPPYFSFVDEGNNLLGVVMYSDGHYYQCSPRLPVEINEYSD